MSNASTVNQSGAVAAGDIVGRDKITNNYTAPTLKPTKIEQLIEKLRKEVQDDIVSKDTIERLQDFNKKIPSDGIVGLEAKLDYGGRSHQRMIALEMKELFAKLLERWSLYPSAQEIFVHILAKADLVYSTQIHPSTDSLSASEIDDLIEKKIIQPLIDEIAVGVFSLDHQVAMGIIYWLAEQCRVRWHK